MPLVRMNDGVQVRGRGVQPMLVFSDEGRSMGLVVDEIVDIAEDKLTIEIASQTPGVLGSAVIRGKATEIIDIGHFLPQAFEDWFRRKEDTGASAQRLLLVEDSSFFRNMLPPVLQAAGFRVVVAVDGEEALAILKKDRDFAAIITDLEMPGRDGLQLAAAIRDDSRTAHIPLLAISSYASPAMLERIRQAGFREFVAKFDRPGLISAVKGLCTELVEAA
jgi:two-component system chemotaxis sensor kinase CheA